MKTLEEIRVAALREQRFPLGFWDVFQQHSFAATILILGLFCLLLSVRDPEAEPFLWAGIICLGLGFLLFMLGRRALREGLRFTSVAAGFTPEEFRFIVRRIVAYYELEVRAAQADMVILLTSGTFMEPGGKIVTIILRKDDVLVSSINDPRRLGRNTMVIPLFNSNNKHNISRIKEELEDFAAGRSLFGTPENPAPEDVPEKTFLYCTMDVLLPRDQ